MTDTKTETHRESPAKSGRGHDRHTKMNSEAQAQTYAVSRSVYIANSSRILPKLNMYVYRRDFLPFLHSITF